MKVIKESEEALVKAVLFLREGGVVICATDTVYGFLADASNKKAVDKIFKIKKRLRSTLAGEIYIYPAPEAP
ncbi:Sua5/YciO/YrdC/YwlC family protein [Candidatus Parcubacteria bacterium]|nr:Sua5/YciO/YrdC/YwlC family protein [Candidatus Parcubacteria bacterium]